MKSAMMSCPLLVPSILERAGRIFPGVEIVSVQPDRSRSRSTMGDLHRRSRRLAAALQRAGIARGDRVATLLSNGQEHLEAYFGVPAAGAVLHALNMRLHPDDLAYVVNHAHDRFLVVRSGSHRRTPPKMAGAPTGCSNPQRRFHGRSLRTAHLPGAAFRPLAGP